MVEAAHPQSVIEMANGRVVQLKVHQCVWSGTYRGNTLPAIQECYRARVARAEIDIAMLRDADFLVIHDLELGSMTDRSGTVGEISRADAAHLQLRPHGSGLGARPPLLSEVVDVIAAETYPTLLELDVKDGQPWPWTRVEELAELLQPVKNRVTFGGEADWNLRRLHHVDPELRMGFTITNYLDWQPSSDGCASARNAYGYIDAHPLGRTRLGSTRDYLWDRLGALVRLVPGTRDIHMCLLTALRMQKDGFADLAEMLHTEGMLLDVWTLNADEHGWQKQLGAALALGADVITTETAQSLVEAARTL